MATVPAVPPLYFELSDWRLADGIITAEPLVTVRLQVAATFPVKLMAPTAAEAADVPKKAEAMNMSRNELSCYGCEVRSQDALTILREAGHRSLT
jgi:hypothetical protein